MKIIIIKKRSEVKGDSAAHLLKHIKYLTEGNHPDKKDKVGKKTQKIWDESICLAPNHTKLTKKERNVIERKLLSDFGGNESPKITTTILL